MTVTSPRSTAKVSLVNVPEIFDSIEDPGTVEVVRRIVRGLNAVADGKLSSVGTVTLTASSTTTTLMDKRIGATSKIFLSPTTANAAAAVGGLYVSATTKNQATLTHASNSQSDRVFGYVVLG